MKPFHLAALAALLPAPLAAQPGEVPKFDGAPAEVYKKVGDVELVAHVFEPTGGGTKRPAVVFFFGGGWTQGSPKQFERQCRHFASRGVVAVAADYRVASRHKVKPTECVADAKSCVRWLRKNADRLGIDPDRVAAGGGSAGGHLAAATATVPGFDQDGEDASVSAVPNALILFNPALVLAPLDGTDLKGFDSRVTRERMGADPRELSPAHHVRKGLPPTLILHGKDDKTVPYATAEAFAGLMKKAGNRCELVGYDGQGHGFFNAGRGGDEFYRKTLAEADRFLASLGYVPAP